MEISFIKENKKLITFNKFLIIVKKNKKIINIYERYISRKLTKTARNVQKRSIDSYFFTWIFGHVMSIA